MSLLRIFSVLTLTNWRSPLGKSDKSSLNISVAFNSSQFFLISFSSILAIVNGFINFTGLLPLFKDNFNSRQSLWLWNNLLAKFHAGIYAKMKKNVLGFLIIWFLETVPQTVISFSLHSHNHNKVQSAIFEGRLVIL